MTSVDPRFVVPAMSAGASTPPASRAAESADLYACWTQIFEGAHAVAAPERAASAPGAGALEVSPREWIVSGSGALESARHQVSPLESAARVETAVSRPAACAGEATVGATEAGEGTPVKCVIRPERQSLGPSGAAAPQKESAPRAGRGGMPLAQGAVTAEDRAAVGCTVLDESTAVRSDESVSVHVSAQGVLVGVRDPHVEPGDALRAAFDVALRLTGRRAGLQRLILNGHTVFNGASRSGSPDEAGALSFIC